MHGGQRSHRFVLSSVIAATLLCALLAASCDSTHEKKTRHSDRLLVNAASSLQLNGNTAAMVMRHIIDVVRIRIVFFLAPLSDSRFEHLRARQNWMPSSERDLGVETGNHEESSRSPGRA
jgi:hypothetical protein